MGHLDAKLTVGKLDGEHSVRCHKHSGAAIRHDRDRSECCTRHGAAILYNDTAAELSCSVECEFDRAGVFCRDDNGIGKHRREAFRPHGIRTRWHLGKIESPVFVHGGRQTFCLTTESNPRRKATWSGGYASIQSHKLLRVGRRTSRRSKSREAWLLRKPGDLKPQYVLISHRQGQDRKSTRLNSSHSQISYAVFCLKKKIMNIAH